MRFDQCTETCTSDCGHCKGRPVESLRTQLAEVQREHNALVLDAADFLTERDTARAEVEQLRREIAAHRDTETSLNATLGRLDDALTEVTRERDEARAEVQRLYGVLDRAQDEAEECVRDLRTRLAAALKVVEAAKALTARDPVLLTGATANPADEADQEALNALFAAVDTYQQQEPTTPSPPVVVETVVVGDQVLTFEVEG